MTLSKEEVFAEYRKERPEVSREWFDMLYEEEIKRIENKKRIGLQRLKSVKDFWMVMSFTLPEPTDEKLLPWLYDVDWHFDRFDQGLQACSKRVPSTIFKLLKSASEQARELHKAGHSKAANELMWKVASLSWTRNNSNEKLANIIND